uniref:DUF4592 domain-containing protein n=1 Tax=Sphaeramia orbicularis TaxID=375764 RepID=A0A672ZYT9_9TELE
MWNLKEQEFENPGVGKYLPFTSVYLVSLAVMFDILLCLFLPLHIPQRSKISLGSKALSHDSVFVSDSSEANEALGASQDSIHGKVKSLQLQLKQAIRLGSPPSLMCVKRTEDMGTMSEDDGLPCSPPEYTTHTALVTHTHTHTHTFRTIMKLCVPLSSQLSCAASSRAVSPLVVVPGDFSQPASPFACLDNSAAKHKLGLRHKACNKRKPANVRQTNTYTLQHPNTPAHTQLIQFTLLLLRSCSAETVFSQSYMCTLWDLWDQSLVSHELMLFHTENSLHAKQTDNQMEEEGEEKKTEEKEEEEEEEEKEEEEEEEEEAKELEQEPEAKGEKLEKTVEDDKEDEVEVEEKTEEVEEPEEAKEDEKEDIQEKTFSEADGGEMVVDLEETADDVNAVNKDEMEYEKHGDQILPGQEEEDFVMMHESQKALDQMEPKEQNLDQEKDTAATEPNVEERTSEQDEEQESIQEFPQETKQEKEPSDVDTSVSSRPSSLTPPQTPTSPSKTSTIHINLVSPSAEKSASCFPLPPSTVEAKESTSTAEEPGNEVEKAEEEEAAKQSCDAATATNKEAKVSAPADETSKVRFTITPAWQRSLSIGDKDSSTLPSSSPAVGGTTVEEPLDKPESSSAKTELVSVVVEGNPNNPFGVRLRKTSALHRFSSEEENAEPLGVKPSVSQPMSNKPALPKKPEVTGDGGGKTKRILGVVSYTNTHSSILTCSCSKSTLEKKPLEISCESVGVWCLLFRSKCSSWWI